jgi:hypothetical protein
LRRFLGTLLRNANLTWLLSLPTWGSVWTGNLPHVPAYGLQPSDEGTELPSRRCLVPSCSNGRWHFTGGIRYPRAWISVEVFDCLDTCVIEFYIERTAFYHDMFTSHLAAFWCICVYP